MQNWTSVRDIIPTSTIISLIGILEGNIRDKFDDIGLDYTDDVVYREPYNAKETNCVVKRGFLPFLFVAGPEVEYDYDFHKQEEKKYGFTIGFHNDIAFVYEKDKKLVVSLLYSSFVDTERVDEEGELEILEDHMVSVIKIANYGMERMTRELYDETNKKLTLHDKEKNVYVLDLDNVHTEFIIKPAEELSIFDDCPSVASLNLTEKQREQGQKLVDEFKSMSSGRYERFVTKRKALLVNYTFDWKRTD